MAGIHPRYERLLEAGLALAAELSLPAALQRIVELAPSSPAPAMGRWASPGRDGSIRVHHHRRHARGGRRIGHIPVGRGILGALIDDARPCGSTTSPTTPARSASRPITRR